jgi:hypothetical protein
VTDVRGISQMQKDGTFLVKTEHLKGGQWSVGREVTYGEAPSAKVQFK